MNVRNDVAVRTLLSMPHIHSVQHFYDQINCVSHDGWSPVAAVVSKSNFDMWQSARL